MLIAATVHVHCSGQFHLIAHRLRVVFGVSTRECDHFTIRHLRAGVRQFYAYQNSTNCTDNPAAAAAQRRRWMNSDSDRASFVRGTQPAAVASFAALDSAAFH